jgi:hypothetical protein
MDAAVATTWEVSDAVVHRTGWIVDRVLSAPRTPALVARYFDEANGFAGSTFDLVAETDAHVLEPADLLAVTLLDVPLSADAVRELLDAGTNEELARHLRRIPVDAALWSAREAALDAAVAAHELLQEADGIGPVRATKILARKRPGLVPVVDRAATALLELPDHLGWATLRAVLADEGRRGRVEALRPASADPSITLLRLLDVAVWLTASGGRRQRTGAAAGDS